MTRAMRPTVCSSVDSQQAQGDGDDGSNALAQKQPKGYRVFHMDGCSFLVKEVDRESSILDLNDVYVVDSVTEETRRPTTNPDTMPASIPPAMYHDVEWASFFPGNEFEHKEPITWVLKVYLIAIKSTEPYELDFDNVFVLNAADGSIAQCPVKRLAPPGTPEDMLQIRIREHGITIDTSESLPDPETVVQSKLDGVPAMSLLEQALEESMDSSDTEDDTRLVTRAEEEQEEDEEDMDEDAFDEDEDDSLSDFLTEVDDDSDSEFDDDVDLDDDAFDDDGAGEDFD
ncbi:hypothetical protein M9434_006367 [Picochlorum sp. BPE23]|nr:hypothetical protein M9434_006367 [Picochlorum sp. BPE23]